jgi:hypothetical protein
MRQRDTLSPFGLPVVSTQLDTFHPRKRPWLSSENLNEMKRTRVYRWVRFLHFEVYTYDIPLVVFHLGGIIPETLNNFEMLGATKKKKLVENYSDILF